MKKLLIVAVLTAVCGVDAFASVVGTGVPPFTFTYDGVSSSTILNTWKQTRKTRTPAEGVIETTYTFTNPENNFAVKCVRTRYSGFNAAEWIAEFTNTGTSNSGVLKDVKSLSVVLPYDSAGRMDIHWDRGGIDSTKAFEPMIYAISGSDSHTFAPSGGRGSYNVSSYFNFVKPGGGGTIVCMGWPGQWSMTCSSSSVGVTVRGGQEELQGYLLPGETVRTPRMLVLEYDDLDFVHSQNLWRRFYLKYAAPRVDGQPPKPRFNMCGGINQPGADRLFDYGIYPDYWWTDAGWYPNGGNWWQTGTWQINPAVYPNGFRAFHNNMLRKGIKTMVWFEPERVHKASNAYNELFEDHFEWLIPDAYPNGAADTNNLLDLGNEEACNFIIDRFTQIMTDNFITVYREDFNMNPLQNWHNKNTADRKGFVENHHIQGHFRLWDTLVENIPGLEIDSCSSGGLRNDYDTMRRALPFLRTDYEINTDANAHQASFYGSAFWLPLAGIGVYSDEPYEYRSCFAGMETGVWGGTYNHVKGEDWNFDRLVDCYNEIQLIKECYAGDFYPLEQWNVDATRWLSWQFNYPEKGIGVVQAFRRESAEENFKTYELEDLDPNAEYVVMRLDDPSKSFDTTGASLMNGLTIAIDKRAAAIAYYFKRDSDDALGVPAAEYNALRDLYEATDGDNWTKNTGWLKTRVDHWYGVTVTDGHVTALSLPVNNLRGPVPDSFANLTYLTEFAGQRNTLTRMPADLSALTALKKLTLAGNALQNAPTGIPRSGCSFSYNAIPAENLAAAGYPAQSRSQTVPPSGIVLSREGATVSATWNPISYTAGTGGYDVYYKVGNGPLTEAASTGSKAVNGVSFTLDVPDYDSVAVYVRTRSGATTNNPNTLISTLSEPAYFLSGTYSVAELKTSMPQGNVAVNGTVSAVFGDCAYLQDGLQGIKLVGNIGKLKVGDEVTLTVRRGQGTEPYLFVL
ncbi:MAG: alpha-galactosidase [Abditibacteriota bacterium]|nr:alpha-galactosidase [Abditibacteriota bacterium]